MAMKLLALILSLCVLPLVSYAQTDVGFNAFLAGVRDEAASSGVGQRGLAALTGATFEPSIIRLDQKQPEGRITFAQYAKSTLTPARIARGQKLLAENAELLRQVSQYYGVPAKIIVALWGKETDFG